MMGSNRADNGHRRMVPQDFHRLLPFSFLRLFVEFCSPPRQTMKLDRSVRIDWSILYDSLRSYNAAALLPLMMSISIRDERSHSPVFGVVIRVYLLQEVHLCERNLANK